MNRPHRALLRWLVFTLLCYLSGTAVAWERADSVGVTLYFDATDRGIAGRLEADLVAGHSTVARKFGGGFDTPVQVYLAPSEAAFRELTRGQIPHWGAGCAFPSEGIVVLRRLSSYSRLRQVAHHELAHILLHSLMPGTVPVWFHEGASMWASHEWRLHQSLETMYAGLVGGLHSLQSIDHLLSLPASRANLAYTQSLLAVIHLVRLGGTDAVAKVVEVVGTGVPFSAALQHASGLSPEAFEASLNEFVRGRFSLAAVATAPEALWTYVAFGFLLVVIGVRRRTRTRVREWEEEDSLAGLPGRLRRQIQRERERDR